MCDHPYATHWFNQAQPDRLEIVDCTICHETGTEPCVRHDDQPWYHAGRRWEIGICSPGRGIGGASVPDEPGRCLPTTEERWHHDDQRRHDYRGACLGCGWAGPARTDENSAVEDAHDHCFPGWRQLPTVRRPSGGQGLEDRKSAARWIEDCRKVYLATGLDPDLLGSGWPLRTERRRMGTRSHWCHVIAGYDLCGDVVDDPVPPDQRRVEPVQESLF